MRAKADVYKKITENCMSYKQVEEEYGILGATAKQMKRNGPQFKKLLKGEGVQQRLCARFHFP